MLLFLPSWKYLLLILLPKSHTTPFLSFPFTARLQKKKHIVCIQCLQFLLSHYLLNSLLSGFWSHHSIKLLLSRSPMTSTLLNAIVISKSLSYMCWSFAYLFSGPFPFFSCSAMLNRQLYFPGIIPLWLSNRFGQWESLAEEWRAGEGGKARVFPFLFLCLECYI